jgi:hypothetical protein
MNMSRNAFCRALASDGSDVFEVQYPGIADLGTEREGRFSGKANSYFCLKDEGILGDGSVGKGEGGGTVSVRA